MYVLLKEDGEKLLKEDNGFILLEIQNIDYTEIFDLIFIKLLTINNRLFGLTQIQKSILLLSSARNPVGITKAAQKVRQILITIRKPLKLTKAAQKVREILAVVRKPKNLTKSSIKLISRLLTKLPTDLEKWKRILKPITILNDVRKPLKLTKSSIKIRLVETLKPLSRLFKANQIIKIISVLRTKLPGDIEKWLEELKASTLLITGKSRLLGKTLTNTFIVTVGRFGQFFELLTSIIKLVSVKTSNIKLQIIMSSIIKLISIKNLGFNKLYTSILLLSAKNTKNIGIKLTEVAQLILMTSMRSFGGIKRILSAISILITKLPTDIEDWIEILTSSVILTPIKNRLKGFFKTLISLIILRAELFGSKGQEFVASIKLIASGLSKRINLSSIIKAIIILNPRLIFRGYQIEELIARVLLISTKYTSLGRNKLLSSKLILTTITQEIQRGIRQIIKAQIILLADLKRRFNDIEILISSALSLLVSLNSVKVKVRIIMVYIKLYPIIIRSIGKRVLIKVVQKLYISLGRIKKHKGMKWLRFREYTNKDYR